MGIQAISGVASSVPSTVTQSNITKLDKENTANPTSTQKSDATPVTEASGSGGKSSAASAASASTTPSLKYDIRDTNHDGIVSSPEAQKYQAKHPNSPLNKHHKASTGSQQKTEQSNYKADGSVDLNTTSTSQVNKKA